jgi:hypothetical protein
MAACFVPRFLSIPIIDDETKAMDTPYYGIPVFMMSKKQKPKSMKA